MVSCLLSVVIPAYNEEAVIGGTVEAVEAYLTEAKISHEIIVADDGSTDRTVSVVRALSDHRPAVRVVQTSHRGKGAAVRRGMLEALGEYRLFMDADHSTPIGEWQRCAPWLRDGYSVVIGSRKIPGAEIKTHQPPLREAMGKVFTWLTNTVLATGVSDVTCGFKCFSSEAARHVFGLQRVSGWGFDAEILFIARRCGYRVKEIPVTWTDDASTKVHLITDALRSFRELISIRMAARRGGYPVTSDE